MAPETISTGLFKLPAEVRATIWRYALYQDKPIKVLAQPHQPGISRICSQFREETLPMYYHVNSFILDNLHYSCNYQHRHQSPAFCTSPTCSSKRVRPAAWIDAIGYKYLKYVTKLHITESTAEWLTAFDLRLEQNVKEGVLRHLPGSCWKAHTGDKDGDARYWYGHEAGDPLSELLQDIIDRLLEPGLSPKAIQDIARCLTTDFGMGKLMPTLSFAEIERVGRLPAREIRELMTCSDSEVRGWVSSVAEDEGRAFRTVLYTTIRHMRTRFQRLKDEA
ncbi:hypothetical protein M409DRAFT_29360 [Zasmidium cellare ATCC 36951]|uniref:F-box domain-containing protein n=1 Tax=Zasmidium cellare ATCC 36951 TaxID=1080233 RepID=A0A6A6BZR5_ZASCE|nr:uncharacterized protein M409DRAFT_29360 [Zasmidium cellare ATCC 36951]KAF2160271.1 hypothetical protein M409DRAFT_29360 [Zasmidium cellare ATCC 36951]